MGRLVPAFRRAVDLAEELIVEGGLRGVYGNPDKRFSWPLKLRAGEGGKIPGWLWINLAACHHR